MVVVKTLVAVGSCRAVVVLPFAIDVCALSNQAAPPRIIGFVDDGKDKKRYGGLRFHQPKSSAPLPHSCGRLNDQGVAQSKL
jgi:hypothetical protein